MTRLSILLAFLMLTACGDDEQSKDTAEISDRETNDRIPVPQAVCVIGVSVPNDEVAVNETYQVRVLPSEVADRLKNQKASEAFKKTMYHRIDNSTTVKQLCAEAGWTEVQITSPAHLTFVKGWVPNKVLRGIERSSDGARIYLESDILWDEDTSRFKVQIVSAVNKISREHAGCTDIDPSSVAQSPSKSTPGDPVFFVTCGMSSTPFNVFFKPSDIEAGKTMDAPPAISQADATLACEAAAKAAATHPSTVDFSRIMDVAYSARPDGRVSLDSSFTAKNAMNLLLEYKIRCLFDGNRMIEHSIVEAR